MSEKWNEIINKGHNIWNKRKNGYVNDLATDNNDFSWIPKDEIKNSLENNVTAKFGIPVQLTGNPEHANVFLCLFNPSVPNIDTFSQNNKKLAEEAIQNNDLKGYVNSDLEDVVSDDIEAKKVTQSNFIINTDENALSIGFINNGEENPYYWDRYYSGLYNCGAVNKEEIQNNAKNLKICNIELVPYRASTTNGFKSKAFINNDEAVQFTAEIIVNKIIDYLNGGEKPVFFMRSVRWYEEAINAFLQNPKNGFSENENINTFIKLINFANAKDDNKIPLVFKLHQRGSLSESAVNVLDNEYEPDEWRSKYNSSLRNLLGLNN